MGSSKALHKPLLAVVLVSALLIGGCASIESDSISDRSEAFAKITDQKELEDIALHGKFNDMRYAAVSKIDNQQVIEKVARSDWNSAVRGAAVTRLMNQNALSEIAVNDSDKSVRALAVDHVTSPEVLARIYLIETNDAVRDVALRNLHRFSPGKENWAQDHLAVFYLKDPELIEKMARSAPTSVARILAVSKIPNPAQRSAIIVSEKSPSTRIAMLNQSEDPQLVKKLALQDPDDDVRMEAVLGLKEQDALAQVALKEGLDNIRLAAVEKVTDQKLLSRIAMEDKNSDIRETAVSHLTDKNEQRYIRMKLARSEDSIAAYERFIQTYPSSKEASAMRKELAVLKSRRLGELVLLMTPKPVLSFSADPFVTGFGTKSHPAPMTFGGMSMERPTSYKQYLEEFKTLLKQGADPRAFRISGYTPASQPLSSGVVMISMGGSPAKVVPAGKGGMTLYAYCKENKITEVVELLAK